ncbi:MAG: thiamine phosphate synthase [Myxococcales bacterium]|nr:MAG: thiamine phosphate synthase [Myxococcales bacterium]
MTTAFPERGLYALVDTDTLGRRGLDPVAVATALLAARPAALQLRAKGLGARDTLALLRRLVPLCRQAGVVCLANDRPDLALLAGCDGVHVGQDDLPLPDVRALAPGLLVGISTHDEAQLAAALALGPSYVAVGPVFATASKAAAEPVVGLGLVQRARAAARCPVVAIGGLDLERAAQIGREGALGAIIGALLPSPDDTDPLASITERARRLDAALRGHP